jgi:hypothetical protein
MVISDGGRKDINGFQVGLNLAASRKGLVSLEKRATRRGRADEFEVGHRVIGMVGMAGLSHMVI